VPPPDPTPAPDVHLRREEGRSSDKRPFTRTSRLHGHRRQARGREQAAPAARRERTQGCVGGNRVRRWTPTQQPPECFSTFAAATKLLLLTLEG
jgi:hypothetical protein